jgi:acyl-CoA reductase-like NAD-dependent aldehyde dehydrogenase
MIRSSGLDSFIGKRWSMMISELKPLELSSVLDVGMTGDGRRIPANMTFPVVNPATEEEYARVPAIDREQLDFVMESAAEAFRTWSQDDVSRCKTMHAAADLLEEHIAEIATLLTAEQGKPFRESVSEVATGCVWLRWYADLDVVQPKIVQDDDQARIAIYRRPLGPSVLITAWNFPVQMALKKIAQALRPGNTVVVKPASDTPLATLRLVELLQGVFPPGVVSAVTGRSGLGDWLTQHPLTRKISFTGSTEVGKIVAASAVDDLKRVTLELGGNDAAIVLDDADPKTTAEGIFSRAFFNNGQVCATIKRVYVHESLFDQVVDELVLHAERAVVGDGLDPATQYGPVTNASQLNTVTALVNDAVATGARQLSGGRIDGPGYFYRPAIVTGVSDQTRLVAEEQFGPALPVLPYRELADAIRRANDSKFGLGGSVWSSDIARAEEVAQHMETGTVWVNNHAATKVNQPFAGAKWSGIGVENAVEGMEQFTQIHTVQTTRA